MHLSKIYEKTDRIFLVAYHTGLKKGEIEIVDTIFKKRTQAEEFVKKTPLLFPQILETVLTVPLENI